MRPAQPRRSQHLPQRRTFTLGNLLTLLEHQGDDPSSTGYLGMYESNQFHLKLVLGQGQTGLDFQARSSHLAARTKAAFHSVLVHRPPSWVRAGLGRALRRQVLVLRAYFLARRNKGQICAENSRGDITAEPKGASSVVMEEKWVTEWGQQVSRSWGWRKFPASENRETASIWGCREAGNKLQEFR